MILRFCRLSIKTASKSSLQRYGTCAIKNLPYDKIFVLSDALEVTPEYFTNLTNDFTAQTTYLQRIGRVNRDSYISSYKEFEKKALEQIT